MVSCWSRGRNILDLVPDDIVEAYLADPEVAVSTFSVRHGRERRHELLSLAEENLVSGLAQDGIHAWGRMYSQLSSTMTCNVQVGNELKTMGMAEAAGMLQKSDVRTRKDAWHGINDAWRTHEESCSAAINAIAGWRLELESQALESPARAFPGRAGAHEPDQPSHPRCVVGSHAGVATAGAQGNAGDGARDRSRADRTVGHARPGAAVGR